MHELSIAHSLVRVAEEAGREAGAVRVTRVHLRLGALSGVVRESLEFAFDFATRDTLLAGAELRIEGVAVEVACAACGAVGPPESAQRLRCRACGERTPDVRSGRELLIRAIDYDVEPEGPPLQQQGQQQGEGAAPSDAPSTGTEAAGSPAAAPTERSSHGASAARSIPTVPSIHTVAAPGWPSPRT